MIVFIKCYFQVCYWSYLSRTCLEIVLSIGLFLIYFCWGMPNLEREIDCDVHGIRHTCVLPNHQVSDQKKVYLENFRVKSMKIIGLNVVIYLINFCYNYFCPQFYFYILAVSSALLCIYILCNLYNLIWIVCPQLGTMYRLICRYQEHMVLGTPITTSNNATNSHNTNIVKLRTLSCDEDITVPLTGVKVVSVKNYIM